MTDSKVYNVLFLCTHNSARSVLAESFLNKMGSGKFKAFSGGSFPTGELNPLVVEYLKEHKFSIEGLRSKSWDEFARPGAPALDFVFTVCDDAAGEVCPVWPGQPVTGHWGVEDPSKYNDDPEKARQVIHDVALQLHRRLSLLLALPLDKIDRLSLQNNVTEIGKAS